MTTNTNIRIDNNLKRKVEKLYNNETISALNEFTEMKNPSKYKRYSFFKQLLGDM